MRLNIIELAVGPCDDTSMVYSTKVLKRPNYVLELAERRRRRRSTLIGQWTVVDTADSPWPGGYVTSYFAVPRGTGRVRGYG